jgi:hypothetical protein
VCVLFYWFNYHAIVLIKTLKSVVRTKNIQSNFSYGQSRERMTMFSYLICVCLVIHNRRSLCVMPFYNSFLCSDSLSSVYLSPIQNNTYTRFKEWKVIKAYKSVSLLFLVERSVGRGMEWFLLNELKISQSTNGYVDTLRERTKRRWEGGIEKK